MLLTRGYSLVELVVTVAIVGILASALVPFAQLSIKRNKEAELHTALREIRTAIDAYKKATDDGFIEKKVDASGYPPSLEILVQGVPDKRSPKKRLLKFLRRIPEDPMNPSANIEAMWGLRSYASTAEDPHEGEDVYDIYSLSKESSINGMAYSTW